jgi:hypothetical protein
MPGRTTHAAAILGPELAARLPEVKVLLVGAGGIGCELCEFDRTLLCGQSGIYSALV